MRLKCLALRIGHALSFFARSYRTFISSLVTRQVAALCMVSRANRNENRHLTAAPTFNGRASLAYRYRVHICNLQIISGDLSETHLHSVEILGCSLPVGRLRFGHRQWQMAVLHFATSLQLPANERPHRDFKYEVIVVADKIAGGWQDLRNGEFRSTAINR